jgi:tRNA(fMet)-specific endonuclease VapC
MKYLLDTNICVYISNHRPARVRARFGQCHPGDIAMSVVTYLELMYGASKSNQRERSLIGVGDFVSLVPVLDLGPGAAENYARIRSSLERDGTPIGAFDLLIAAHALSLHLTLVTNNVREFRRIKDLRVENWAGAD